MLHVIHEYSFNNIVLTREMETLLIKFWRLEATLPIISKKRKEQRYVKELNVGNYLSGDGCAEIIGYL